MTATPTAQPRTTPAHAQASAGDDAVIRCLKLTKTFKDFWMRNRVTAVDAIDLEVKRGEVFGLLGPNGSGKSTTIKMILGLLSASSGRVLVFGKNPDHVATKKRIGYLPEESYLYRFLSARETLDYYGRLFHQNRAQRHKRIDMLLEMVGLEAVARRPVGEFSKGMQRRIGLAQALINDPELLILDEPTTGLDPIGTRQIKDLIVNLGKRGKTIVLCSHLLGDVEDVCDRVSIMYGGKVRAQGTCDELLVQSDTSTIHTPKLDAEAVQEIEQVLERRGMAIDRVDQPRQKLEALFLDIVHQAQKEGASTSGARTGGPIANFLAQDAHLPEDADTAAVIDQLTGVAASSQTPTAAAPKPGSKPEPEPTSQPEPTGEDTPGPAPQEPDEAAEVLDELTGGQPTIPAAAKATPPPEPQHTDPAPPPEGDADLSVIGELTGQDDATSTPPSDEPDTLEAPEALRFTESAGDLNRPAPGSEGAPGNEPSDESGPGASDSGDADGDDDEIVTQEKLDQMNLPDWAKNPPKEMPRDYTGHGEVADPPEPPAPPEPDGSDEGNDGEEKPDTSFLDALRDVPDEKKE